MFQRIHHTAFSTPDLDRLLHFYCELMGAELERRGSWGPGAADIDRVLGLPGTSGRSAMIKFGAVRLELWEFATPVPDPKTSSPPANALGLTHICIEVDDVDAAYQHLVAAGLRFHCEPMTFGAVRATYGRDPDGNIFELLQSLTEGS